MESRLDPQVETVEQPPALTQPLSPSPLDSSDPVISTPAVSDDIDWEIEILVQRYSDMDKDTKSDGSTGCH